MKNAKRSGVIGSVKISISEKGAAFFTVTTKGGHEVFLHKLSEEAFKIKTCKKKDVGEGYSLTIIPYYWQIHDEQGNLVAAFNKGDLKSVYASLKRK